MNPRCRRVGWVTGVIAIGTLLLGACTASLPRATASDVERARASSPEASQASLDRGRYLFQTRCSSCHDAYQPRTRTVPEWRHALDAMADRARLKPPDEALVWSYLQLFAAP